MEMQASFTEETESINKSVSVINGIKEQEGPLEISDWIDDYSQEVSLVSKHLQDGVFEKARSRSLIDKIQEGTNQVVVSENKARATLDSIKEILSKASKTVSSLNILKLKVKETIEECLPSNRSFSSIR